jgi:hypothetical protein
MANLVAREVLILDAALKEDEGTDDEPKSTQFVWLQLQDTKNSRIYTTSLSLDDIKEITNMKRYLEGRELINFAINLKSRETPLTLVFNPENEEINAQTIMIEEETEEAK